MKFITEGKIRKYHVLMNHSEMFNTLMDVSVKCVSVEETETLEKSCFNFSIYFYDYFDVIMNHNHAHYVYSS
jgi:hypothetical protein